MAFDGIGHIALVVPDLRELEQCYCELFDMTVDFREGMVDGEFGELPAGDWADAADAADEITMSFVTRGAVTLALHEPTHREVVDHGPIDHLNVAVPAAERERICERAPDYGCEVDAVPYDNNHRYVTTPDGVVWELAVAD